MKRMNIKQVCQYLEIGRTSFYNYRDNGMPVHYTLSKRPYCYKEEIDQWLRSRRKINNG